MEPELMREIVTIEAFDSWFRLAAIVSVPIALGFGLLWVRKLKQPNKWLLGAITGVLCGLILPLLYGLWCLYLWRIRIDLDRDFVGLHRVDVLIGNLFFFALAGAIVGLVARLYANWLKRQLAQGE